MTNTKTNITRIIALLLVSITLLSVIPLNASAAVSWPSSTNIKTYVLSTGNNTTVYKTATSTSSYGTIYASDLITIHGWSGSRLKITYPLDRGGTKTGYIDANKVLKKVNGAVALSTMTASKQITAYRRPTGNTTTGWIDKGDKVWILYNDNSGRVHVIYPLSSGGYKMGWVNRNDIVSSKSSSSNSSSSSAKNISLNVPYYRQDDSRWKNVKISSKTLGSVGCTTTCMSMIYSYKTNKTVYPDNMCRNYLKYSGNDLLWSSITKYGFTREKCGDIKITNNILKKIYTQLNAGKPVVVGSYISASSNKGHWVVVKGYTGSSSSSFSASDFVINDPINSSRTTLQQFLSSYPYVNSIVY